MADADGSLRTEVQKGTGDPQDGALQTEAQKDAGGAPPGVTIPVLMYSYAQRRQTAGF